MAVYNALYRIYRRARGIILVYLQSLWKCVSVKRRTFIRKSRQSHLLSYVWEHLQRGLWGGGKVLKKFLIKPLSPIIRAQT